MEDSDEEEFQDAQETCLGNDEQANQDGENFEDITCSLTDKGDIKEKTEKEIVSRNSVKESQSRLISSVDDCTSDFLSDYLRTTELNLGKEAPGLKCHKIPSNPEQHNATNVSTEELIREFEKNAKLLTSSLLLHDVNKESTVGPEVSDDEEFVDAEEEFSPVISRDLEKAFDALFSFKGPNPLAQAQIMKIKSSRKVNLGNIKYDLSQLNINKHVDIIRRMKMTEHHGNEDGSSDELRIVSRKEWNAEPAMDILTPLKRPVPLVIINHTAGLMGFSQAENCHIIKQIQAYHTESEEWDDIGYNFLVGMDGLVYEGRGWLSVGAHCYGHNSLSVGVAFVGRFSRFLPSQAAMKAFHRLVATGVQQGHIASDYKLLAASQLRKTESPGKRLYDVMKGWPHWSPKP